MAGERAIGRVTGRASAQILALANVNITGQFTAAILGASFVRSRQLLTLAEVFRSSHKDTAARTKMFTQIGELAQAEVIESYEKLVEAKEGPASRTHYRSSSGRLAGGVMHRALERDDFFEAHTNGIRFINRNMLNEEAAHWYRLAFGAGEVGRGSHFRAQVSYGSMSLAAMGIDEEPDDPFSMRAGFWVGAGGEPGEPGNNDMFYPASVGRAGVKAIEKRLKANFGGKPRYAKAKPTAGIVGEPFFEAGVQTIADSIGPALDRYYRDAFSDYRKGEGAFVGLNVKPSRPNPAFRGRFTVS